MLSLGNLNFFSIRKVSCSCHIDSVQIDRSMCAVRSNCTICLVGTSYGKYDVLYWMMVSHLAQQSESEMGLYRPVSRMYCTICLVGISYGTYDVPDDVIPSRTAVCDGTLSSGTSYTSYVP